MMQRVWKFSAIVLFCCSLIFGLAAISPVNAGESEELFIPVIFNNFPPIDPVFQGSLAPEELIINYLPQSTTDLWTVKLLAGEKISIAIAPGSPVDITLSIYKSDDLNLIHYQNMSPPGKVETISDLMVPETGTYNLLVQSVEGQPTDYALIFLDKDSYNFILRGTLRNNESQEDSLPEDVDHFWFFNALEGQIVSFTITPIESADPYIELFDPSGSWLEVIDDTGDGEPEKLVNYMLPESGLYGIRIGEFDFQSMDYQITISLP